MRRGAAAGDRLQVRHRPTQGGEAASGFARDEGLEPGAHQRRLFVDPSQLSCFLKERVVDDESGSHMHIHMHI